MLISKMLDTMSLLSVGPDIASSDVRNIYLIYLNLAHFELYNEISLLNDDIIITENLTTTFNEVNNSQTVTLSNVPFNVSDIYFPLKNQFLEKKCLQDFIFYQRKHIIQHSPRIYTLKGKTISIYPFVSTDTYNLDIFYVPIPFNLEESTEEEEIPYPVSFHYCLLWGALYYLSQDEEGFKNTQKSLEYKTKWQDGKNSLTSYLYNNSNKEIRTFTNV